MTLSNTPYTITEEEHEGSTVYTVHNEKPLDSFFECTVDDAFTARLIAHAEPMLLELHTVKSCIDFAFSKKCWDCNKEQVFMDILHGVSKLINKIEHGW
jgi:hypothetical protein